MRTLAAMDFQDLLSAENLVPVIRVALLVFVALPLVFVFTRTIKRFLKGRVSAQHGMLAAKTFSYLATTILLVMVLRELGFKLTTLLGAAGIVGVAVGFAAQTSLSNLISGVFLVAENTFEIGDFIKVGDVLGTVKSVDLLSVKLRTLDNKLVRIPNETLVKSELTNYTAFAIRRLDIPVGVAYGTDLERAMRVLAEIADANPQVMDEPRALVTLTGFGDSSVDILFGVWIAMENYLSVRDACIVAIHQRFAEEGIVIPFPQRTVHAAGPPPD